MTHPSEGQLEENRRLCQIAVMNARMVLKAGDRLRVAKCPGGKRWITFKEWSGGQSSQSRVGITTRYA